MTLKEEIVKELEEALGIVTIETSYEGSAKAILDEKNGRFFFIKPIDDVIDDVVKYLGYKEKDK
jgi:hypothetical protein